MMPVYVNMNFAFPRIYGKWFNVKKIIGKGYIEIAISFMKILYIQLVRECWNYPKEEKYENGD